LIVNPAGPGVSADANTVQNVTIVASSDMNRDNMVVNAGGTGVRRRK